MGATFVGRLVFCENEQCRMNPGFNFYSYHFYNHFLLVQKLFDSLDDLLHL